VDMERVSDVAAIHTTIDVPSASGVSNVSGVPAAAGTIANFLVLLAGHGHGYHHLHTLPQPGRGLSHRKGGKGVLGSE
jgi:hypothetical protein